MARENKPKEEAQAQAQAPEATADSVASQEPETAAEPQPSGLPERPDRTVTGGRYRTADGQLVNANGEPIEG